MTDIAVIGAGAFGAWTALHLVEAGHDVLLVDMHGPGHALSSSGGESRNIRAAYAGDRFYSSWARDAWVRWHARQHEFGTRLVYASGSLRAASDADLRAQAEIFTELGAPFELLDGDDVRRRWPQVHPGNQRLFYEPESGALAAAGALQAVERAFRAKGGRSVTGRVALRGEGSRLTVMLDGLPLACGAIVLACGPWLPSLVPDLLAGMIRTPRRELVFVTPSPGDDRFSWQNCPNLVDPLGWTTSDLGQGFKVAPPMRGIDADPDDDTRSPSAIAIAGAERFLAARLPALAGRPIASVFVSQLENTASEDFIIDHHPGADHVVIAGGGSGHAFKFGPVLGDHVARLVLAGPTAERIERFRLRAHRPLRPGEGG